MTTPLAATRGAWIAEADCRLDDFHAEVSRHTDPADYPLASDVRAGVPVYSAAHFADTDRHALRTELIAALSDGPGVVVFEGALEHDVVDRASAAFTALIDAQR